MQYIDNMFTKHSSVVLIGFALDGPTNQLLYVDNTSNADLLLGYGSQLSNAVHEAYNAGAQSVFAVRINGTSAFVDILGKFKITHAYAGTKYNDIEVIIEDGYLKIDNNIYQLSSYENISDLVKAINYDFSISLHKFAAEVLQEDLTSALSPINTVLSGAIDELTLSDEEVYNRLETIYYMLFNHPVNIIVPLCAYYDGSEDFDTQLLNLCKDKFSVGETVMGIMGVKPLMQYTSVGDEQAIQDRVDRLKAINKDYGVDGRFLSVVASEGIFIQDTSYAANCAAAYAGLVSSSPYTSTTNKKVEGMSLINTLYTDTQLNDLSRYVVIHNSIRTGIKVLYGTTMYKNFTIDVSTVINKMNEIIQNEIYDINEIEVPNVGEVVLKKKIEEMLKPLIDNREIRELSVAIEDLDDRSKYLKIKIDFIRYNEVRAITAQVGVQYGI